MWLVIQDRINMLTLSANKARYEHFCWYDRPIRCFNCMFTTLWTVTLFLFYPAYILKRHFPSACSSGGRLLLFFVMVTKNCTDVQCWDTFNEYFHFLLLQTSSPLTYYTLHCTLQIVCCNMTFGHFCVTEEQTFKYVNSTSGEMWRSLAFDGESYVRTLVSTISHSE